MSFDSRPPKRALGWIEAAAPRHLRESVMGDLEEEWRGRAARSRRRADLWFIFQAATVALRLGWFDLSHTQRRDGHPPREGDGLMETLWNDAKFGARMLSRTPGFTLVAVITLALGIGANTAIFSLVNALLIQPLALPESERLISVGGVDASGRNQYVSYPDFEDIRKQQTLFEGFTAFVPQSATLTGGAEPQRVRAGFVSDNFFSLTGIAAGDGRVFRTGDDEFSADPVVVLQHQAWQGVFGGAPMIGKTIILNNSPFTVVGVLPKDFKFPFDDVEVWMPHHTWPVFKTADNYLNRATPLTAPIGKLKPGVSFAKAQTEIKTIGGRLASQHPEAGAGRGLSMQGLRESLVADGRDMILLLMGAVTFVLLIACANVANLMLARASSRQTEIATRAALGAGRGRLVKQMLTEAALLWFAGGVLGLAIGYAGLQALLEASPMPLPGGMAPRLDFVVLAFTFALAGVTGIAFGAFAAFRFSRPNLTSTLKEGGRTGDGPAKSRLGGALVVAQVALTLVMLAGSALMLRSFQKLTKVDVGFKTDHLLTLEYRLPANKYPTGEVQWETHRRMVERVRAVPGVVSASVVRAVPFGGNGSNVVFEIPGAPPVPAGDAPRAQFNYPDAFYFETMGIPLVRGRALNEQDTKDAPPVVVINQTMADKYWPNADPIGRSVVFPDPKTPMTATIVGVVGNVKHYGLGEAPRYQVYAFQAQQPHIFNSLVVRTQGEPTAMTNAVRAAVWSIDPEQAMWKIFTMEFLVARSLGPRKFLMSLMTVYATVGLVLAAVGLYGIMAYAVSQRSREIGVRMALGAQGRDVLNLVVSRGMRLTGIGLAVGLVASIALGGSISSMLYGIQATDPLALSGAAAVLLSVAAIASYIPARRATKANPVTVLHRT